MTGTDGVVQLIVGVPFWGQTGLTGEAEAILVLAIFASVALAGESRTNGRRAG